MQTIAAKINSFGSAWGEFQLAMKHRIEAISNGTCVSMFLELMDLAYGVELNLSNNYANSLNFADDWSDISRGLQSGDFNDDTVPRAVRALQESFSNMTVISVSNVIHTHLLTFS